MKVVLLKDVPSLGRAGDIKHVSDGYARNYLMPRGLAQVVSPSVLKVLELRKAIQEKKAELSLEKTEQRARTLEDFELRIPMRIGEGGKTFASVTADSIADALTKAGKPISKHSVRLEEPLKELGEFPVVIQLDHGLEATIRVHVIPESVTGKPREMPSGLKDRRKK
ncbi:MAG: 50S ribosomal protein L9 [Parcubacteria group bacterium]|nr:50S ribosomal protein L9 [Parcubacteria group bacterium]